MLLQRISLLLCGWMLMRKIDAFLPMRNLITQKQATNNVLQSVVLDNSDTIATKLDDKLSKPPNDPAIRNPEWNANACTAWSRLLAPRPWEKPRGIDHSIRWTGDDDCKEVAQHWFQQVGLLSEDDDNNNNSDINVLVKEMTTSLQAFQDFCQEHLLLNDNYRFKARIVCSRGTKASTKCPVWHVDHVPVRWIQSLTGPGVIWTNPESVHWHVFQRNLEEEDDDSEGNPVDESIETRNSKLVNEDSAVIYQGIEGEAVLLRGKRWNELSRQSQKDPIPPVVHKSPSGLLPFQGRILLTIDVEIPGLQTS